MGSSVELIPSGEAASRSGTKEFPFNVWNLKVHDSLLKSPPIAPVLNQNITFRAIQLNSSKINFNIIPHLLLGVT
jgi:hypothetical protein